MTDALHVAKNLDLPAEIAVQKQAILAMSGAGKSNTAVVLAEELHDAGIPWVAVDPKGDWWGVRSDRAGTGPGLPVPIFGGLHADLPLEPTAGRFLATLIAERRLACVLDVSEFDTNQARYGFLADFAETLLRVNRDPLHLFLEEADEYLPQKAMEKGNLPRCLGQWQRIVKRGRFRGLGSTLVSQRSAAIDKSVLYQADTLIAMRVTGSGDKKAIAGWVDAHSLGKELVDSLDGLEDGEGWVWSPQRLKLMERVKFRRRRTFDSGETPKLGAKKARPAARLADVDLAAISDQMTETIERAKADDPTELRRRIAALETELRKTKVEVRTETVEVERIVERVPAAWAEELDRLRYEFATWPEEHATAIESLLVALRAHQEFVVERLDALGDVESAISVLPPEPRPAVSPPIIRGETEPVVAGAGGEPPKLKAGARKILATAAHAHPRVLTLRQLATLAGYSPKSSTWDTYLSRLRAEDLIRTGDGRVVVTDEGFRVADVSSALPQTPDEVLATWRSKFKAGARVFLDLLVDIYPEGLTREELVEAAGRSNTSSTTDTYLSTLRANGVVENRDGRLYATAELLGAR